METTKIKVIALAAILAASQLPAYSQDQANFTTSLAGKHPGLTVITRDGIPGSGSARMMIRGIGSYAESPDVNTLKIYVDGFEVKSDYIDYLSAEEIESVEVLKDASQLALYGMNGANGVIYITTKRGTVGAPKISFRSSGGVSAPINVAKPLGSYDYARLYNQAWSNDHGREWDPYYDMDAMAAYKNGTGVDVDWYDEVFRSAAPYADANLSIRGGSELAKYTVVLDYANQQGFLNVRNTDRTHNASFAKYGVRTNLDMQLNKILTVSVDIGGRLEDRARPNYSLYSLVSDVMNYPANIYPIFDELSTDPIINLSGTAVHPNNPVGSLIGLGWTTSRTKVMQANFKFKEDLGFLLDGLYLQEGFSFYSRTIGNTAKTSTYARYQGGVAQTADVSTYLRSQGYWSSGKERWMQGNVILGWKGALDNNVFDAMLSAHISDFNGTGSAFYNWKYRYINYGGLLAWNDSDRLEASLGFSLFGSDAYAPGHRYVFYPTASFGIKLTDSVKLRTSAGFTGATEAYVGIEGMETNGRYLYKQYYTWTGSFVTGMGPSFGGGVSGIRPLYSGSEDVTAEQSFKANVGVDAGLFDGRLKLTADYFVDLRSGILTLDRTLMDYYGAKTVYTNLGRMLNHGLDASAVWTEKKGEFEYSVFGNLLFARNIVLDMGEVGPKYPYNAATGHPYGSRMGLECIGFYELKDFDLDGDLQMTEPVPLFGSVQPGDLKYKDQDGDGYVDDTDIVWLDNPSYPTLTFDFGGSAQWRGFDLSVLFTSAFGATVNLLDYSAWKPFLNYGTAFEWASGAWAYYPEAQIDTRKTATFPRLTAEQNEHNYRSSSFWIKKNNYLRLKNLELGYSFDKLRVYLSGQNLLTVSSVLSKYKMDPETVNYGYPAAKSVCAGVQINF